MQKEKPKRKKATKTRKGVMPVKISDTDTIVVTSGFGDSENNHKESRTA